MIETLMVLGLLGACYLVWIRPDPVADRYIELCRKERELRNQTSKE